MGPILELSENVVSSKVIKDGGYIKLSQEYMYLFRSIRYCKKKNVFRCEKSISYSTARDIFFRKALQEIGLEKSKFGLHIFRAWGTAATAAVNKGIYDRLKKMVAGNRKMETKNLVI